VAVDAVDDIAVASEGGDKGACGWQGAGRGGTSKRGA
jgi:hypothetical protein